ncbi:MAG: hypothetical protein QXY90_06905 [Candidatus Anstonellales archaeon]
MNKKTFFEKEFWKQVLARVGKLEPPKIVLALISIVLSFLTLFAYFSELVPEKYKPTLSIVLGSLLALTFAPAVLFILKSMADAQESFENEKRILITRMKEKETEFSNKEQEFLKHLNDWRSTLEHSLQILSVEGEDKITGEIRTLLRGANCITFFGNFRTYKKLLSEASTKLIVCDREPREEMLSPAKYEYRYLYSNFGADLLLFQYPLNKEKSLLIFGPEGAKRAWVIDFNFAIHLGLFYNDYPLLYLPAQISAQIRSDPSHSPLLERASYRRSLPRYSLVDKEFSFVLRSIENGYMKPLFPPTDMTEVISRWNEQIFQNFVDYATKLIENNFDKLLITWKIDNESLQTINYYKIFSGWIERLNKKNSINVERVILIDKTDIGKSIDPPIQIEGIQCKTYEDIVSNLTKMVILKNVENPQYKYCFANMADHEFPPVCKKDFAVFLFHNGDPIIQTSELDMNNELLKLFFRLPKTEKEIKTYIGFFENCFRRTPPPSYIYNDIKSALERV